MTRNDGCEGTLCKLHQWSSPKECSGLFCINCLKFLSNDQQLAFSSGILLASQLTCSISPASLEVIMHLICYYWRKLLDWSAYCHHFISHVSDYHTNGLFFFAISDFFNVMACVRLFYIWQLHISATSFLKKIKNYGHLIFFYHNLLYVSFSWVSDDIVISCVYYSPGLVICTSLLESIINMVC